MSGSAKHTGTLGRIDLLQALISGDKRLVQQIASQLELHYVAATKEPEKKRQRPAKPDQTALNNQQIEAEKAAGLRATASFWMLESREYSEPREEDETERESASVTIEWRGRPKQKPRFYPLLQVRDLIPAVLPYLRNRKTGHKPDIPQMVERISKGLALHEVPRLPLRTLNPTIQVIDDRHTHLIPYWKDHILIRYFLDLLSNGDSQQAVLMDGQEEPRLQTGQKWEAWQPPEKGGVVFILSDLGALAKDYGKQTEIWLNLGRAIQQAGCQAVALLPCDPDFCDPRLKTLFAFETLDKSSQTASTSAESRKQQLNRLLTALSPVIRLEPGLLRQMRLQMAKQGQQWQMDAAVESLLWQHADLQEDHSIAASWNNESRHKRLLQFAELTKAERETALSVIRQWRQPLSKHIWFEELTGLDKASRELFPQDVEDADAYIKQNAEWVQHDAVTETETETDMERRDLLGRMDARLPQHALEQADIGPHLQRIRYTVSPKSLEGVDPRSLKPGTAKEKQTMLYQEGEYLRLGTGDVSSKLEFAAPLAEIRLRHNLVSLQLDGKLVNELTTDGEAVPFPKDVEQFTAVSDCESLYFKQITKPKWADRFWQDKSGLLAETISSDGKKYCWAWYPGTQSHDEDKRTRGIWYPPDVNALKQKKEKATRSFFISYAQQDSRPAKKIASELMASGFDVYLDSETQAGNDWREAINSRLKEVETVIILLSKATESSSYSSHEVLKPVDQQKPVFIVRLDNTEIPKVLADYPTIDVRGRGTDWQIQNFVTFRNPSEIIRQELRSPDWTSAFGHDQYGLYADLEIKGISERFRWIEPGMFMMGSPQDEPEREPWSGKETQHEVTLTQGFWLADTTITQELWLAVMEDNPSDFKDDKRNPVDNVSWDDAQAFIDRLNKKSPGLQAKLPTEAQWEYACRAGTTTPFSFGQNISPDQVNYDGNSPYNNGEKGLYRKETVPVKSLPANDWGLYEMHGNVWEWCADSWQEDLGSEEVKDPEVSDKAAGQRVLRGGAWDDFGLYLRSADRFRSRPGRRSFYIGFRLSLGHSGSAMQCMQAMQEDRASDEDLGSAVAEQAQTKAASRAGKFAQNVKDLFGLSGKKGNKE